ncbi:Uncharacterised protein [Vibrio cholerae]|nr:Uncharacterised protein [Vibrio cholerae]
MWQPKTIIVRKYLMDITDITITHKSHKVMN